MDQLELVKDRLNELLEHKKNTSRSLVGFQSWELHKLDFIDDLISLNSTVYDLLEKHGTFSMTHPPKLIHDKHEKKIRRSENLWAIPRRYINQ